MWRVFAGSTEYLAKNVVINVPSRSEKECCSEDWNIVCEGKLQIDRETATVTIA